LKRKKYSKELKSKVALAAIKGNQTANEIASKFGIHVSLVNRWKEAVIDALKKLQYNQNRSDVVHRPDIYPVEWWTCLFNSCHGLAQSLCPVLEAFGHHEY